MVVWCGVGEEVNLIEAQFNIHKLARCVTRGLSHVI